MRSLVFLLLTACAPGLAEPSRFDVPDLCGDVQNDLLVPRCARTGCHVPFEPASGVEYLSADLPSRLVGVPAAACPSQLLIDPTSPDDSFLLARVSEAPTCEGAVVDRMPLVGPPLDEAELACLRAWVHRVAGEAP